METTLNLKRRRDSGDTEKEGEKKQPAPQRPAGKTQPKRPEPEKKTLPPPQRPAQIIPPPQHTPENPTNHPHYLQHHLRYHPFQPQNYYPGPIRRQETHSRRHQHLALCDDPGRPPEMSSKH